jgi:hypothetical protein
MLNIHNLIKEESFHFATSISHFTTSISQVESQLEKCKKQKKIDSLIKIITETIIN